ncbi:MAG: flagellar hook-associated protein FlgL [Rickettsiaceae bacterium]|jgi:hypothetical protein|nr:flagellar hook-associated protein FlgL [Rickettsiaceae bacterium]
MAEVDVKASFSGAPSKALITQNTLMGMRNKMKDYAKYSDQAISGVKYRDFSDLSQDGLLKQYMELHKKLSQNQLNKDTNEIVKLRLEATDTQLQEITKLTLEAQRTLTEAQSAAKGAMNLPQIIKGYLGTLKTSLCTKENGKSLFGGFDYNDEPINDIVNISNLVDGEATSNYALSSQAKIEYEISGKNKIEYNILAGDEAFVKIIGSMHLALEDKLPEAAKMLEDGRKILSQRLTEVGNNQKLINDANILLQTQRLAMNEENNELFSADQNEAATLASLTLDSLRNSQWIMARVMGLNLIDILGNN